MELSIVFNQDNRIAYDGSMNFNIRRFQLSGLQQSTEAVKKQLIADIGEVFTCRQIDTETDDYSDGSTFFLKASEKPRCGLEMLAMEIFKLHTKDAKFDPERSGCEWWTQVIDIEDDIGFHWDRDYGVENDTGAHLYPHLGSVTYFSEGTCPTIIVNQVGTESNCESSDGECSKLWISKSLWGKHICFDGKLFHGASDSIYNPPDEDDDEEEEEEEESEEEEEEDDEDRLPRRVTFLVNIWLNHIPIESKLLPKKHLKKLKLPVEDVPLYTVEEKPDSITKFTPTDCNVKVEWKFINSDRDYLFEAAIPSYDKMKELLDSSDIIELDYGEDNNLAVINKVIKKKEKAKRRRRH